MDIKSFKLELKELDEQGIFEGYASVFGNRDFGGDVVMPGSFKKTLKENSTPVILWQHNPDEPIGVTLEASEDDKGLRVKGQLNLDTQRGRECYSLLKQGALKGLSIGYQTIKDAWEGSTRMLKEIRLLEWSPVTFPMNPLAKISTVKSLDPDKVKSAIEALSALLDSEEPENSTQTAMEPQEEKDADQPESSQQITIIDKLFEIRDLLRS